MKKRFVKPFLCGILSAVLLSTSLSSTTFPFQHTVYAEEVTEKTDLSSSDAWQIGHYSKYGNYSSWPSYVCTKNSFECSENAVLKFICGSRRYAEICILGEGSTPIKVITLTDGKSLTFPEGSKSFKISMGITSDYNLGYRTWKDKVFADGREYSFEYTYEKENIEEQPTKEAGEEIHSEEIPSIEVPSEESPENNNVPKTVTTTSVIDLSDDELWRIGHYNKRGGYSSWPSYVCLKEPIECYGGDEITVTCGKRRYVDLIFIDDEKNALKEYTLTDGKKATAPDNTELCYVNMCIPSNYNLGYKTWKNTMFNDGRTYSLTVSSTSIKIENDPITPTNKESFTAKEWVSNINVGWNLGNSLDSHYGNPDGTARLGQETIWGNPKVTQELIDKVAEQGFNTIRIPVSWYYHTGTDSSGNIYINEEWLARVKEVVDYAYKDNLNVIINTHHDHSIFYAGTTDEKFNQVKKNVELIWAQIAEYFKDYDEHLVFESFNEIDNVAKSWNYSAAAAAQLNTMNQTFVNTVRNTGEKNATRVLMIPTLLDGNSSDILNAFTMPTDTVDDKIIVTIHYYAPQIDQDIEPVLDGLETFSKKVNAPIIIGECGSNTAFSPAEYRVINASNFFARAYAHGFRCIWWDNGSNYKIIDRKTLEANSELLNAIIKSKSFTTNGKVTYNSYDSFAYKTLNQTTGLAKDDIYWGTTIINVNGKYGLDVPSGKRYMTLLLNATEDAVKQRIHCVYFFDKNDKLLSKVINSNGFTSQIISIPDSTAYARIGINNSYSRTYDNDYKNYFDNGYMSLTIGFLE